MPSEKKTQIFQRLLYDIDLVGPTGPTALTDLIEMLIDEIYLEFLP
jgi:hypothetical protein